LQKCDEIINLLSRIKYFKKNFICKISKVLVSGWWDLPPFRNRNPGWEVNELETRMIALGSVIAALYAVGVIVLAPISFSLFQVRVADALIPLSIIFGMPAVLGVTLGNIIANIYGGLGYIDIFGGSIANFLAAYVGWKIGLRKFRGSKFIATIVQNLVVSSIVGSYLAMLFDVPLEVGLLGVLLGSIISINIIGYILVLALKKFGISN
jgi:uncharacterized membrane protein